MPTVIVRPTAAVGSGTSVTGAASVVAALSDNSDSSYVTVSPGGNVICDFPEVTIPGALRSAKAVFRGKAATGTTRVYDTWLLRNGTSGFWDNIFLDGSVNTRASDPLSPSQVAQIRVTLDPVVNAAQIMDVWAEGFYASPPTVSVSAPTGTITSTSKPPATWAHTAGADGDVQARAELKLFSQAQYSAGGFDPAVTTPMYSYTTVGAGSSHTPTAELPNGTYRAYVRTAQSIAGVLQWSTWSYSTYTLNVAGPTVQSVTAAVVTGGLQVSVTRNTGGVAWDAGVFVERQQPDGSWTFVRGAAPIVNGGANGSVVATNSAVIVDYEAPAGVAVVYRARGSRLVAGLPLAGAWVSSTGVAWQLTDRRGWLKDPYHSTANGHFRSRRQATRQRRRDRGVHYPVGARYPIVRSDARRARSGQMLIWTDNAAEYAALEALLEADVLLWQSPPETMLGDLWISPGDVDPQPADQDNLGAKWVWSIQYDEITRPQDIV